MSKLTTVGLIFINKKTPISFVFCKATSLSKINVRRPKKTTATQPNKAINGIFLSRTQEAEMDISVDTTKIPVPHTIPKQ